MIKRMFYNLEHGNQDDLSDPSSSSSGSEAEAADATEESEEDEVSEVTGNDESGSIPSGHDSEDDSGNDGNSTGHDNDDDSGNDGNTPGIPVGEEIATGRENLWSSGYQDSKFQMREPILTDEKKSAVISKKEKESSFTTIESYILKCKSVFRCRICPTVVCLNDETLNTHLKSKRHARSEKLLKEGKLKAMLNIQGQIEGGEESEEEPTAAKGNWEENPEEHKKQNRVGKKKRHMGKRMRGPTRGAANKRRRH